MPVTFQGGQALPAVGTAAYTQAQTGTGAGTYNPTTGTLTTSAPKTSTTSAPTSTSSYSPTTSGGYATNNTPQTYPVVTSQAATANYNNIQSTYQNQIQPNIQASQTQQQAQKALPVIPGYNVSATQTGALGEQKATQNSTGQSYYISPQKPALTANDVQGIIGGGTNPAPTAPATPSQTADQTVQNQYGISTSQENQNYQQQTTQTQTQLDQAYSTFQSTIQQIQSGSFPLSGAQQSLVDATNQAFQQMTTQANLKAAALSSETGGVSNMVNATAGELLNITSQQAATVAKLELGFQQQDYQEVTDSYNEFRDYETQKMTSIQNLHDAVMSTYNSALSAAQAQQTFNQTVFQDAASIKNSQYDFEPIQNAFGQRIGTQVFDKQTGKPVGQSIDAGQIDPTTGATTPIVTTGSDGTPDPTTQAQFLQTIPPAYRAMVQGIANGNIEPPTARTAEGAQILSWVASYDPTLSDGSGGFDATKYQARLTMQKSLANYTAGSYGSALISANKVISHLGSFLNSSAAIPGTGAINPFNINALTSGVLEAGSAMLGDTGPQSSQAEADQEARGLTDEMTKFFKGTGGTDVQSLENWGSSLNPNASPGTQHGVVQGTLNLFSGQLNSFIQQYTNVMGHAPDLGTIIQPQTLQTLSAFKNAGYQVDIPGVYYTDKNAYIANGGSTDSLNSAYSALQAQGIPTTPDNILQAAQIISP